MEILNSSTYLLIQPENKTTTERHLAMRITITTLLALSLFVGVNIESTIADILTASDNAYVRKSQGDQDESEVLQIKSNGNNSNSRLGYLRFDTSGLTINPNDAVFLDLNLDTVGSGSLNQLNVWSLNNGVAGETTWDSSLTYGTRPDGTGNVPNANLGTLSSYGYVNPGNISVPIDTGTFQTLLTGDTNNEVTLVLSNNSSHDGGQTRFSALGNTGGNLEPTIRVISESNAVTITESQYGGTLSEQNESTFSYDQSGSRAKVGEGGSGNNTEYIQMMLFELPEQPTGGFQAEDTSLRITIESQDVANSGQNADIWAIGYVPAEEIGDVGTNLNNGSVTDIDDFFLNEADTEISEGWNIGSDNTVKIWDDLASNNSLGTLGSPVPANSALTDFINNMFDNHGASAGDFLVLRNNYDVDMSNYDDWYFYTGSATNGQPLLTLTAVQAAVPEPSTFALAALSLIGLGWFGWRRRQHV